MGNTLQGQGKLEEAIRGIQQGTYYSSLIMLKPTTTWALLSKIKVSWRRLLRLTTKAISLKPDYADAYINMGVALKDQGKLEEAIEVYNKALSLKPDYAEVYSNMGQCSPRSR